MNDCVFVCGFVCVCLCLCVRDRERESMRVMGWSVVGIGMYAVLNTLGSLYSMQAFTYWFKF